MIKMLFYIALWPLRTNYVAMATLFTKTNNTINEINYNSLIESIADNIVDKNQIIQTAKNLILSGAVIAIEHNLTDKDLGLFMHDSSIFNEHFSKLVGLNVSFEYHSKINDDFVIDFVKKCPNLSKINFNGCYALTDASIVELCKSCRNLEDIDISWCGISERSVFELAKNCRNLKRINVRSCYITDRSIAALVESCKELKHIHLPWCKSLTDKTLFEIANNVPNIISLDLRGNENITSDAILYLSTYCNNLETIHLKRSYNAVTDGSITSLSKNNPYITKINLRGCFRLKSPCNTANITNQGIIALAENCKNLSVIDLAWQKNLSDAAINAIANNCINICSIDISGCREITENAFFYLINNCKKLEKIILFENTLISNNSINIAKQQGCLVKCY